MKSIRKNNVANLKIASDCVAHYNQSIELQSVFAVFLYLM